MTNPAAVPLRFRSYLGPTEVMFGSGRIDELADHEALHARRVGVVLSEALARQRLGERLSRLLPSATLSPQSSPHPGPTQLASARKALTDVEVVVGVGGGGIIGIAKALAVDSGGSLVLVPTTYAGSELTMLFGSTSGGRKTVTASPAARASLVVYDPDLSRELPRGVSGGTLLNCLAHIVEGASLCADPRLQAIARAGVCSCLDGWNQLDSAPERAREQLAVGGYLGGAVLSAGGFGIHHALCHVLGGFTGLPHGVLNALVLPLVIDHLVHAPTAEPWLRDPDTWLGSDAATVTRDIRESAGLPIGIPAEMLGRWAPDEFVGLVCDEVVASAVDLAVLGGRERLRLLVGELVSAGE